jgi:hypothetical protein
MAGDWTLGLEQQRDLTVSAGSTEEMAATVRRGADLRLYMTTDTYEETLYFQQTYSGCGDAFAGLMSHHHSYVHRGDPAVQPYISLFKYDASGTFSHIKWMPDNQVFDESYTYGYGIYRWYVCDRWRSVFEHDAEGNKISGDLEELCELVRQGRSIQVGVRQLFGLAADDDSGPEHTSFLSTMQPLIDNGQVQSNCDLVLVGGPCWPFSWDDGLHLGMMRPSTSGEIVCYLVRPGHMPFARTLPRRAMVWMVADKV